LHTDKTDAQVIKLIEGVQEMSHTASKTVKLPHQHTVKLMAAGGPHQRLEFGPPLLATRDSNIEVFRYNL